MKYYRLEVKEFAPYAKRLPHPDRPPKLVPSTADRPGHHVYEGEMLNDPIRTFYVLQEIDSRGALCRHCDPDTGATVDLPKIHEAQVIDDDHPTPPWAAR